MSIWDDLTGAVRTAGGDVISAAKDVNKGVEEAGGEVVSKGDELANWLDSHNPLYFGGSTSTPATTDPKKAEKKTTPETQAPTPESPWEQLANAQADQYLAMTKAIDPLTSGATLPALDETMSANASQMLGQSATSPVSQWLNQQTQAAQAQGAPVTAAEAGLGKAEDANSALVAGGLQGMGQAETALMQAAPYQQLLQSLASEVPYHLASGYSIPGLTAANTPQFVQQAESNVGVTPLTAAQGSSSSAKGLLPAISVGITPPPASTPTGTPPGY